MMLFPTTMWANGDPVASFSAITLSKNPKAKSIPGVQLLQEKLYIRPEGCYTQVTVKYLLHNSTHRNFRNLCYGFPVDYYNDTRQHTHWVNDDFSESLYEVGWRDDYVQYMSFFLNGQLLSWKCSKSKLIQKGEKFIASEFYESDDSDTLPSEIERKAIITFLRYDLQIAVDNLTPKQLEHYIQKYKNAIYDTTPDLDRRWFYTHFDIQKNATIELEVSYRIANTFSIPLYQLFNVFTNDNPDHGYFFYDFSPASHWGNGAAQQFYVELDTSEIMLSNYFKDGYTMAFKGLPLTAQGNLLTYHASNFDFAKAAPFELKFSTQKSQGISPVKLLHHQISPDQFTITLSGSEAKQSVSYLTDMDPTTAAVISHSTSDTSWINIHFLRPTRITGLLLFNGNCKDSISFAEGGRIDKLKLDIQLDKVDSLFGNDFYYWDADNSNNVTTDNTYPNYSAHHVLYWKCAGAVPRIYTWDELINIGEKINLQGTTIRHPWYIDRSKKSPKVTDLRISISDIRKGTKYPTAYISELLIFGDDEQ